MNTRNENGEVLPAVCVKAPPVYQRAPKDVVDAPYHVRDESFDSLVEDWWRSVPQNLADECLQSAFRGYEPKAAPAGRSNGWVVVRGLRPVSEWNLKQKVAWDRFCDRIAKSIQQAEKDWHDDVRARLRDLVEEKVEDPITFTLREDPDMTVREFLELGGRITFPDGYAIQGVPTTRYFELRHPDDAEDECVSIRDMDRPDSVVRMVDDLIKERAARARE